MFVATILLAHIAILSQIVEKIIALENAMLFRDPVIFRADKGLQDRRGNIGMIIGAKRVADVVQQCHHNIFFIPAIAVGAGCSLQAVLHPVDGEPAKIAVEQLQVFKHPVGHLAGKRTEMAADDLPVFL